MIYFKTSHVKVYPSAEKSQPTPTPFISKHLMLKFILATDSGLAVATPDFKTSHVKVYLNGNVARPPCFIISKHLMLKFILWRLLRWRLPFQISKHLMLKFIPTHFLYFIQSTIPDSPVFINVLKIFTSRRALCQKN